MTSVSETLHVTVQHTGDRTAVVAVAGDVDLHTASVLRGHALAVVEQGVPHLVLDLAQVDFVDSTGLSTLIHLLHATHRAGGSLLLAEVPDRLMRMINMTGISQLLPVHPTVAEALAGRAAATSAEAGADAGTPD
ncbi:anti-sigma factor antagonist [Streptomyces sp. SID486]|uniref:STAS domain-containing protein n=1 Tax=unclassified Streptomyces TaxID=2593676 RepID=UPI001368140E|nr:MULTISPECIES: STAS domain-containing protein [unclassified Streptomyces]MYW18922.1 anti-sigma factor antagonist [Streptomyces sp. SID2955]MYW19336.1 anti-sigma factor antagonist [Streptomyces sp. SID2955]MYW49448.1 anti-sigma factor antagonist [Streptomyces sp. SID161]MYX94759.1 anti-sigma factor antagonist [Streptomyces sp. SID486]